MIAARKHFPAVQLLEQVGLAEHADRIGDKALKLYCTRLHRAEGLFGPARTVLYVGRQRASDYKAALLGEGGGPGHTAWRDVPSVLKCMYRQHLRLEACGEVWAQAGQETAVVYALRLALEGTGIEVTGGLYAYGGDLGEFASGQWLKKR